MCMHVKEEKVKVVVLKELRLLQKLIELEMSVVSNCLECIRMGRGNRYVSLGVSTLSFFRLTVLADSDMHE